MSLEARLADIEELGRSGLAHLLTLEEMARTKTTVAFRNLVEERIHMGHRRVPGVRQLPKALVCGMLEDRGRALFLKTKDMHGTERLEMPYALVYSGDPVSQLTEAFREQTGIDGEVGEIAFETKHNAGSRRRRRFIPCLVFRIRAKGMRTRPAPRFSGYRWLSLEDAKKENLGRNAKWLTKIKD